MFVNYISIKCIYDNGENKHCILLYILSGDYILSSYMTDKPYNYNEHFIHLAVHLFISIKPIIHNNHFHSFSLESKQFKTNNNLIILIYAMYFVGAFYNQNMNDYVEVLQIININGIIPISDVTFTTTKIIDQYIYQISIENMVYWIVRNVPYGNRYG